MYADGFNGIFVVWFVCFFVVLPAVKVTLYSLHTIIEQLRIWSRSANVFTRLGKCMYFFHIFNGKFSSLKL